MNADTDIDPRNLRWYARPHRARIAFFAVLSFSSGALEAAFLVIATRAGLAVTGGDRRVQLYSDVSVSVSEGASLAGLLIGLRLTLSLISVFVATRLTEMVTIRQRHRIVDSYLAASWPVQKADPAGRLQHMLTTFTEQATVLTSSLGHGITAALSLFALVLVSIFIDLVATSIVLGSVALLLIVLLPVRRMLSVRSSLASSVQLEFAEGVAELGSVGIELHSFGVQEPIRLLLQEMSNKEARFRRRVHNLVQLTTPVYVSLAYSLILLALIGTALQGTSTHLQSFGTVVIIMLRSLTYGQQLQSTLADIRNYVPVLERMEDLIDRYQLSPVVSGSFAVGTINTLSMRNVSFQYSLSEPVLSDVSFESTKGDIIGIIGPSGSGKTTLVEILIGVQQPIAGTILIDERELVTLKRSDLAEMIGLVPQYPRILSGSIEENVTFFREGVSTEEVRTALHRANLLKDVTMMPDGVRTFVGERGGRLSGGQRQRLAIARAILTSPQILILDEPTSAVDTESEAAIRESLQDLSKDSIVIIVAHRLSTLEICNQILVVDDGSVEVVDTRKALNLGTRFLSSGSQSADSL